MRLDLFIEAAEHAEAHPMLYRRLVRYCREMRNAGIQRFGIARPWERARYEAVIQLEDDAAYKLNNDLKAGYARLIIVLEDDLADHITVRGEDDFDLFFEDGRLVVEAHSSPSADCKDNEE